MTLSSTARTCRWIRAASLAGPLSALTLSGHALAQEGAPPTALPEQPALPSEGANPPPAPTDPSTEAAPTPETSAESTDPNVAQARELFKLGVSLARQGEWSEALRALRRSEALHAHPVTTYNIGYAERALGRYTRALSSFTRALHAHETTTEKLSPHLESQARGYLTEVQSRLARVAVTIEGDISAIAVDGKPLEKWDASGARIIAIAGTRDDATAEAPPASTFDLLVDPGQRMFVLSQPNARDVVVTQTFTSGASTSLKLSVDDGTDSAPPAASTSPPPAALPADHASDAGADAGSWYPTAAWVSYGVGAAGIVVGSIFLIRGLDTKSRLDSDDNCNRPGRKGECPNQEPYISDLKQLERDEVIATIGYAVGIAGVAAGTVFLLLSDPANESAAPTKRGLQPWVGLGSAGVRGRF